jgi:hypothetical protein
VHAHLDRGEGDAEDLGAAAELHPFHSHQEQGLAVARRETAQGREEAPAVGAAHRLLLRARLRAAPVEQGLERLQQAPFQPQPEGAAPCDGEREGRRALRRPMLAPALHQRRQSFLRRLFGQGGIARLAEAEAQKLGRQVANGVFEVHVIEMYPRVRIGHILRSFRTLLTIMRLATERRLGLLLAVLLVATALLRLVLGCVFFGFHTGDDVEILQEGFRRALGWPYQPWDIRNLFVSDVLVAPVIRVAAGLGVTSTRTLVWLAGVPFALLASLNVWLVFQLARRWLGRDGPALLAAVLYACHWIPLGYGSTVYPRTASTACILLAAWLLAETPGGLRRAALAGGLVAVAFAVRYSEAIFLVPLLAVLCLEGGPMQQRAARCAALLGGFAALCLLTVGVEDQLTWGRPFASLAAFVKFTLVERRSSSLVPSQPWFWYFRRLPKWLPVTLLPLLWRARRVRGALPVALCAVLPLLLLSAIHQKQLRYLQGVIPFLLLLAAAGAWSFWEDGKRFRVVLLGASSLVLGLHGLHFLSHKSMAAVSAAQTLAAACQGQTVALSQPWAYGGTLYLRPGITVLDLPYPLTEEALESALPQAGWAAVYEEDLRARPAMALLLHRYGFAEVAEMHWGESKPVVLYRSSARGRTPVLSTGLPARFPRKNAP